MTHERTGASVERGACVLIADQAQEWLRCLPHLGQACDELVIVVQQGQRHVRPTARKRFDRPRVHRAILQALKYERRLDEPGVERIVPQAVLVEREIERPLLAVGVVEERERPFAAPLLDPLRRQQMMAGLGEHDRRRQQHQPVDALAKRAAARIASVPPRLEPISATGRVAAPADRLRRAGPASASSSSCGSPAR